LSHQDSNSGTWQAMSFPSVHESGA
jgi:hypothetical protein